MSDELTFLRWYYRNSQRFEDVDIEFDEQLAITHDAYERETGNKVPNDYRKVTG